MLRKLLILLSITIGLVATQASMHVDETPDEEYLNLGKNFPSVGFFFKDGNDAIVCGSGTLINTEIPQLEGRVVLTAARIFQKEPDSNQFVFSLNGKRSSGQVFMHPNYKELQKFDSTLHIDCEMYADIAIYFLDMQLKGPAADLDFKLLYHDCLGKYVTTVGFGVTGHVDGVYRIYGAQSRRASYSYASHLLNVYNVQPRVEDYEFSVGEVIKITTKISVPPKAVLLTGPPENTHGTYTPCFPIGVSSQGDIGGGVFNADGKLIATVQSGVIHQDESIFLIRSSFYPRNQNGLDTMMNNFVRKDKFQIIQNVDVDVDLYLRERVQNKLDHERYGNKVFINYHQDWLKKQFAELAALS